MIEYKEAKYGKHTNKGYEKIFYISGEPDYWLDGTLHRVDGPARVYASGIEAWYIDGRHHREDGPAVIFPDGHGEYWLNGDLVIPETYHLFSPLQLARLGLI